MEKRKSFIFYTEWIDILADYPADLRLSIYEAAAIYAATGEIVELSPLAKVAFKFIKGDIDRNNTKFEEFKEKQRRKGKMGGAPVGNQNALKNNPNNPRVEKQPKTTQTTHGLKNNPNKPRVEKQAKQAYNVNENENENVNENIDNKADSSLRSESASSQSSCDAEESAGIDFDIFKDFFNGEMDAAGSKIPRLQTVSARRKAALNARVKEHGRDAVADVVRKAARSSFLNGGGDRAFIATFDWLMRPNNFPKVLDGNYDNNQSQSDNGTDNRRHNQADAKRRRDAEFAEYIAGKLSGGVQEEIPDG